MLTVNKFIADGKKVDYIFGDLTDIPISESACGELWEFMITILNSSFKILKPNGKFMTHVCIDCIISDITIQTFYRLLILILNFSQKPKLIQVF